MTGSNPITEGPSPLFNLDGLNQPVANPVVQVLSIKRIQKEDSPTEVYRMVLSDGQFFLVSMVSPSLNYLINEGKLVKGTFVRLVQFEPKAVNGKRVILISDLHALTEYGAGQKIGEPIGINEAVETASAHPNQPTNVTGQNFYGGGNDTKKQPSHTLRDENYGNIQAIEAINPYGHSWTIRARITKKTPIREWHNQKGEGRLFSVTFMDESGEIRATVFNSVGEKFDAWNEMLQEGSVYFVSSPCEVKLANKKFNNTSNDYELFLNRDSNIEKAQDQSNVPAIRYNFIPIGDLEKITSGAVIDCIGILKEISELGEINSKSTGKAFAKRDLTIADDTLHTVRLTIWGDQASNFDVALESVVAFQSAKVSDFNRRSLSLLSSGGFEVYPDIEQSHRLKGWYEAQGRSENFENYNNTKAGASTSRNDQWKTISQINEENLGRNPEKADFFTIKATIEYMRHTEAKSMYYEACRSESCNKKVVEHDIGAWHCAACNKDWDAPQRRYVLSISVADHTGSTYLSAYDDAGKLLLGKSADELHELFDNDKDQFKEVVDNAMCRQYIFKCRAKLETYQDTERVRISVSSVQLIDFKSESKRLQELIKAYEEDDGMFMN